MDASFEILLKGALCLLALPVVLRWDRASKRFSSRRAGQLLVLAAVVAVAVYYNLGAFHGRTSVHYWEQFHYFLGSRYFPELGYEGLYAASIQAEMESATGRPRQDLIRDLRTNQVVSTLGQAEHREEVKARFSEERWRRFVRDHRHFLENMDFGYLYAVRKDHGYNPTPSWTFVARLATAWLPAERASLALLGFLDPLLLAIALGFVFRTYGSRIGTMSVLIFGLGYPWRYDWIGGAILRLDWLAAVTVAVCLLHRQRYRTAGGLLAYAALVRLFPLAFLLGPGVLLLRAWKRREPSGWAWRMAQGFLLVTVLGIGAGMLTGRGPAAWTEFRDAITLHQDTWLTNNVGLTNLLLYGPATMQRELVDFSQPEPWLEWQGKMDRWKTQRRIPIAAAMLLVLALVAVAAWQGPLDESVVLGLGALYAVFLLTCYYWAMLLLVPIRGGKRATAAVLTLSAGLFGLHLVTPSFEMIYGLMSWALLVLVCVWVAPELRVAWKAWRDRRGFSEGSGG